MKKVTRDIYIAGDGKEFESEAKCKAYEAIEAEKEIISKFIDTQQWDPKTSKGYATRTLVTFHNLMIAYVEYKINANNAPAQIDKRNTGATVQG